MEQRINEITRVTKGSHLKGEFFSETDVRVDGVIDGSVFSLGKVVVGESGIINGNVHATSLDSSGKITGLVTIKDVLSLRETAVMNGDCLFSKIFIEIGASIEGSCKKITDEDFDKIFAADIPEGLYSPATVEE